MMRRTGAHYAEIAEQCGFNSPQACAKAVAKLLKESPREEAEEYRALANERFDRLILSLWEKATQGNLRAIDRVITLEARRSRMFGYDMPLKVASTDAQGNDNPASGALELLRAKLDQLAARRAGAASEKSE